MKYELPDKCPYNKDNNCDITMSSCNYTIFCEMLINDLKIEPKKELDKQVINILESWIK